MSRNVPPRLGADDSRLKPLDARVARSRAAVLAAARRLLFAEGRDAVNPVRVAAASGVGRATIYRNWPDPARLLVDAVTSAPPAPAPEPTGDLEADLTTLLDSLRTGLIDTPLAPIFATLIERAEYDTHLEGVQRHFADVGSRALRTLLEDAVARGDLTGDIDPMIEALVGPLFYRRFISRQPIPVGYSTSLVRGLISTCR